MTPRHALFLGTALVTVASAADAQQSRDDLLDAMTRHVQICAEISDSAQRLACYDKVQNKVGDVQAPAPARTPTPLGTMPSQPSLPPANPPPPAALPPLRRTGPRPVPNYNQSMPLVSLAASNLTYGESRYWQVTVTVTSNTTRSLDTQVRCSFLNAGNSVGEASLGPVLMAAGEQITTELIGPPTTAFVDSTNCRVVSP